MRGMRARATLAAVLALALVSCRSDPPWAEAWSRSELTRRMQQLSDALDSGKATFSEVLDFAEHALEGLDREGSSPWKVRAKDGAELGSLVLLPATDTGIRAMQLSLDTAAREELLKFDEDAWSRLELTFAFGSEALEHCSAQTRTEVKASLPLLQSITEEKPLLVGGTLRVDREGNCTWHGRAIRMFKEGPPWQERETEPQPRGKVALADPRLVRLQQLLEN